MNEKCVIRKKAKKFEVRNGELLYMDRCKVTIIITPYEVQCSLGSYMYVASLLKLCISPFRVVVVY